MNPCMHVGTFGSEKSPLAPAPASSGELVAPSPDGVESPASPDGVESFASPDGVWSFASPDGVALPPSLVPTPLLLLQAATVRAQITPDAVRRVSMNQRYPRPRATASVRSAARSLGISPFQPPAGPTRRS
jgi:hypothetical protein